MAQSFDVIDNDAISELELKSQRLMVLMGDYADKVEDLAKRINYFLVANGMHDERIPSDAFSIDVKGKVIELKGELNHALPILQAMELITSETNKKITDVIHSKNKGFFKGRTESSSTSFEKGEKIEVKTKRHTLEYKEDKIVKALASLSEMDRNKILTNLNKRFGFTSDKQSSPELQVK